MSAETKLGCGNRGNRRCWNRWHFEPFGSAGSIGIKFKGRVIVAAVIAALFAYGSHCIYSKKSRIDLRGTNLKVVS
jgi:hypothetical protein